MLTLQQKLSQQLKLLPQQIQYQKLLQLNNLALEMRIQSELDQNPMLEELPDEEADLNNEELKINENEDLSDYQNETETEKEDVLTANPEDEFSYDELLNDNLDNHISGSNEDEGGSEYPSENVRSLRDHLIDQLKLCDINDDLYRLGEEIIGNINNDGYLRIGLEEIVKELELFENIKISKNDAEKLLSKIQHFEPLGIGARSLQECLLIQVNEKEIKKELKEIVKRILSEVFDDFLNKKYEAIENKLQITREQIKEAINIIQHLDPKPGEGSITDININQVTPDMIVDKIDNKFVVFVNEKFSRRLRINANYFNIYKKSYKKVKNEEEKKAKQFLKEKLDDAKWFIDAVTQRNQTMLRIMYGIIEKQRAFFESGKDYLRPMILKEIADLTNLDISTISRVVNGKYVQTQYGIFELKYFFSEGLETDSGVEISNKKVRTKIQELINGENKQKPLTDDEIAELLQKDGIKIARRTVAKYREILGLPIAKMRREL